MSSPKYNPFFERLREWVYLTRQVKLQEFSLKLDAFEAKMQKEMKKFEDITEMDEKKSYAEQILLDLDIFHEQLSFDYHKLNIEILKKCREYGAQKLISAENVEQFRIINHRNADSQIRTIDSSYQKMKEPLVEILTAPIIVVSPPSSPSPTTSDSDISSPRSSIQSSPSPTLPQFTGESKKAKERKSTDAEPGIEGPKHKRPDA